VVEDPIDPTFIGIGTARLSSIQRLSSLDFKFEISNLKSQ